MMPGLTQHHDVDTDNKDGNIGEDLKGWEASGDTKAPQEPSLRLLRLAATKLKDSHDGKYGRRNCCYLVHTFSLL